MDFEFNRDTLTGPAQQTLDLVVTSDPSIAHLAGALGVPVWVALSLGADWRFLVWSWCAAIFGSSGRRIWKHCLIESP